LWRMEKGELDEGVGEGEEDEEREGDSLDRSIGVSADTRTPNKRNTNRRNIREEHQNKQSNLFHQNVLLYNRCSSYPEKKSCRRSYGSNSGGSSFLVLRCDKLCVPDKLPLVGALRCEKYPRPAEIQRAVSSSLLSHQQSSRRTCRDGKLF
jgi:hypothetical protein